MIDFSAYRKYDWKEHFFLKNYPESRRFTIGGQLVQSNVNDILMKRGYEPWDGSQPEFFITQFITARMGQDTHSVPAAGAYPNAYMWPGSWYTWNTAWFPAWDTYVENYVEGILLLDVVDAKTNKLLWRCTSENHIQHKCVAHQNIEALRKKQRK